ncbi:hypothetical protein JG688_00016510 [Phytophthora aleatoria]|uniref:Uncharacterized protein n=1 Tax=Phytophthora aleatoria TaxID=2496075 RepID=A0A8J5LW61_9STRA|nr:hypothetical protein JG688_00016510 [Phytophthora aleatoria]
MKDLYRRRNLPLPPEYGEGMTALFSGLKPLEAERDQSGDACESGKRPPHVFEIRDAVHVDSSTRRWWLCPLIPSNAMEPNVPIKVRRDHSNVALGVCRRQRRYCATQDNNNKTRR